MWQKAAESARKRRRGKGSRVDLSRAPVFRKRQQSQGTAKIAKGSLEASRASHPPDDRKESEAGSNPVADEPKSEVPCEAAHRADVSTAGLRLRSASAATAGPSPAPDDSRPCQTGAVDGDPAQRPHTSLRSSDVLEGTLEDATRHTDVESTTPTSLEQDASRNNLSQTTRFASDEATPITSETNASSASSSAGVRVPPVDCFGAHLSNTGKSALRERLRLSRTEALKSSSNTSVTQENTGTLSVGDSAAITHGADAISHSAALSSDDVGSAPAHNDLDYGYQVKYLGYKPRALNNMQRQ